MASQSRAQACHGLLAGKLITSLYPLSPAKTTRFCKANAQTAHSLIHWKHALNDWVIDRLKSDGHLAAPKLAEREDWSTNKRSKYANRIVDEWEDEGEIKALYRDFKINLDVARQGKATRWSK
jgi:hypothetical protein